MKVSFEPAAREELDAVLSWIAKDNPRAAFELVERIEDKVMQLAISGTDAHGSARPC
jgi:plasmid stabilization system protein ParE